MDNGWFSVTGHSPNNIKPQCRIRAGAVVSVEEWADYNHDPCGPPLRTVIHLPHSQIVTNESLDAVMAKINWAEDR